MPTYQIYNDINTIRIVTENNTTNIPKLGTILRVNGDSLYIYNENEQITFNIIYTDVTVPLCASAESLRSKLNAYIIGSFRLADGANLDAFNRLRTSHPVNLFNVQSQYDVDSIQMEIGATGTGQTPTHSVNSRMVALSCTAGTGVSFTQSYQYSPYQPGKSQLILMTGVAGTGVANTTVDFMYGDASNGIIIRQNGATTWQIIRRTSISGSLYEEIIDRDDWNIDCLDGTGVSGFNVNLDNAAIFVIDLQFLAMGRVRVGVDYNGCICYAHEFLNAFNLTTPYMQTASLPVRMVVTATGSSTTKTAYFKCASVNSEGGYEVDFGFPFGTPFGTATAASGVRTHLISVRPLTTFNTLTNRALFLLDDIHIGVTGANPIDWELCVGAAFTVAPTWANINSTYSAFEYGTGGTYGNLTNGIVLATGHIPASNSVKQAITQVLSQRYPISLNAAGAVRALGTLTLLVSGVGGNSACRASLNFREIR